MRKKSQKKSDQDRLAELEQELQVHREREHRVELYLSRIITFNPLSLPAVVPGKRPGALRAVDKQKQLALKALVILEPNRRLAQEILERHGAADGADPEG